MAFTIEYTGLCLQGLVRKNNEDNLSCEGRFLPIIHTDVSAGLSGTFSSKTEKSFAVFDGLGGEECGEIASHLAARTFGSEAETVNGAFPEKVKMLSEKMNRAILDHKRKNRIRSLGSTVASLFFEPDGIAGFNIGDSRCYRFSEGTLNRLSVDHIVPQPSAYAGYLTQCLGVPEKEYFLEPAVYYSEYHAGDIYLLCTDGLTKMVGERRISAILKKRQSLDDKLQEMKDIVLRKGAVDNMTIQLFQVSKRTRRFSSILAAGVMWLSGY